MPSIHKHFFKIFTLLCLLACPVHGDTKPNIVVILADDMGYGEVGCQECGEIPTPYIDSIAKNGVSFTDGYANHPVCSPSRAGLLTGRYQHRFGFEHNSGPEDYASKKFGVPRSEPIIAERLKKVGYATGMVGKWHVGFTEGLRPFERGFKGNMWEGGIRVPFMVQWPGRLPAGEVYHEMVMGFDVHATALAAAGAALPVDKPLDGTNLIPYLVDKDKGVPHDRLFWRSGDRKHAARIGDWKLVQETRGKSELYDLKNDIGEVRNLAETEPEMLKNMQAAYAEWDSQMIAAKWIRQDRNNAKVGGKLKSSRSKSRDSDKGF